MWKLWSQAFKTNMKTLTNQGQIWWQIKKGLLFLITAGCTSYQSNLIDACAIQQWRLKLWNSFSSWGVPIARWNIYTNEVFGNIYDRSVYVYKLMGIPQVKDFWIGFPLCSVLLWSNKLHHHSQQFLLMSAINQRQHNSFSHLYAAVL